MSHSEKRGEEKAKKKDEKKKEAKKKEEEEEEEEEVEEEENEDVKEKKGVSHKKMKLKGKQAPHLKLTWLIMYIHLFLYMLPFGPAWTCIVKTRAHIYDILGYLETMEPSIVYVIVLFFIVLLH